MKKQILVSLDGSELAEAILPHAATIARLTSCELVLLRSVAPYMVVQPLVGPVAAPDVLDNEVDEARDYLETIATRLRADGLGVHTHVVSEYAANAICAYAEDNPAVQMIAIATHGRSGLRRLVFGSVAEHVLHSCTKPLLLIRPSSIDHPDQATDGASPFNLELYRSIAVPLDGSPFAEQALGWALALASAVDASLMLITAVPSEEYMVAAEEAGGVPMEAAVEHAEAEQLSQYLKDITRRLRASGRTVANCLVEGDPAESILKVVEQDKLDIIVMSTHGRSGWQRFWMGSVAEKVLHGATTPVLLVRATEKKTGPLGNSPLRTTKDGEASRQEEPLDVVLKP